VKRGTSLAIALIGLVTLACQALAGSGTPIPIPTLAESPYDRGRTLYGFFPSPSRVTIESVMATFKDIGEHGDVALVQQNIAWNDFAGGADVQSQAMTDIHNQVVLAHQNGLEAIFVVDPLNGLNRREFAGLPFGWRASFANPKVRSAFTNFTLRIVREFHPKYLGLASEINTYADTHPDDFQNYLSLYREVYALVKAESPETQVFVTFQWEELNNLIPGIGTGKRLQPNWEQVEVFEPQLDLWVISSYPFIVFPSGADIPADYYFPLLTRTTKPLAVAEGGFPSEPPADGVPGDPQSQVDYLRAIHTQIGGDRLAFWIYLILNDLDLDSYAPLMKSKGQGRDVNTLGMFTSVGLRTIDGAPKPALEVWDSFRTGPDHP
jgi:hypothetical protein